MKLAEVKELIPDYGRDIKLNLEAVLSAEGAQGLTPPQIWGVALASAYALKSQDLVRMALDAGADALNDDIRNASKGAATIMAMNNVYYRSQHLMGDAELKALPARLRMNIIGKPGIEKADFELMCFAISALAGCGQCLTAHLQELRKAGISNEGIQASLKIASVLNATEQALQIREL
ncbi:MAG: carboxymuconolactone decarboxylase family protein [Bdellovibrionales bacterium]|nr:carboxymuconolactone decarboxylase family protein [Bdellovibrionales bacterium]